MNPIFYILALLAMIMVLASLVMGLFFMARSREGDAALSNKMMQWRVYLQAGAVLLFILAMGFGSK